jgi:glycosyltransferase involved in cell wall biosynthesis
MGSAWTTDFLRVVEKPLQELAQKRTFRFLTVGARADFKIKEVDYVAESWSFKEENHQIGKMDIGIMPLPDNDWTRSKGGYKLLQYMSGGIPCVASPVGINRSIVKHGITGYLASTEEEWLEYLEKLITNPELRANMGQQGRKDAVELYSREVCFRKLIAIFGSEIGI